MKLLTFNRDDMLSDLVLQTQIVDALDQVVDSVDVWMDGLEPVDLRSDCCWVGQNKLRPCRAGLCSLARNSPRTELTSPWARRRSGPELGRDGLGYRDRNGRRDRPWCGHGWLRLLRDTGHWDARLEIHYWLFSLCLMERITLLQRQQKLEPTNWDWGDANKRSSRDAVVWKAIDTEASIVGRQLQQNAAHIITTWLRFIFRYWPDLYRAPLFFCLYKPAVPTTRTLFPHRSFGQSRFP